MKTILLVNADEIIRENTSEILELSNYLVMAVENLRIGWEAACFIHPDLILCDERMNDEREIDFIRKIRGLEEGYKIPVILLTNGDGFNNNNPLGNEVSEILSKPFHGEELLRMMSKYLPG